MRRTISFPLAALLLLGCAGSQSAQKGTAATASATAGAPLSTQERDAAVKDLEDSRNAFLSSIKGLSDAQLKFKPAPDRWSVAEVAEHIAIAEERLYGMVTEKLMKSPVDAAVLAQVQHDDARLRAMVTDRSHKIKAPEVLQPTGRFPTTAAAATSFEQSRDKAIEYVKNTQDDLHGHASMHPVLKALDGYQWLLLLSAHTARHTAQIDEVKADPNFPKS